MEAKKEGVWIHRETILLASSKWKAIACFPKVSFTMFTSNHVTEFPFRGETISIHKPATWWGSANKAVMWIILALARALVNKFIRLLDNLITPRRRRVPFVHMIKPFLVNQTISKQSHQ